MLVGKESEIPTNGQTLYFPTEGDNRGNEDGYTDQFANLATPYDVFYLDSACETPIMYTSFYGNVTLDTPVLPGNTVYILIPNINGEYASYNIDTDNESIID